MGKINVGKYKTTDYADERGWGQKTVELLVMRMNADGRNNTIVNEI
jgi:hypothetical protein